MNSHSTLLGTIVNSRQIRLNLHREGLVSFLGGASRVVVQVAGLDKAHFITMTDLSAFLFFAHSRSVCLDHNYQRSYRASVL